MNFDNSQFDEDCERCSPLRRHAKVEAHISLDALRRNLRQIRSITSQARVCCVVKADAYGHGAPMVCRALQQEGIKDFAVSGIAEAQEVRLALQSDMEQILILGYTLPDDLDLLFHYHITQTVFSLEYALALSARIQQMKAEGLLPMTAALPIHIKVDTGMNRLGFMTDDVDGITRVCKLPGLSASGIFTHFAMSDEPQSPMTQAQFDAFIRLTEQLQARGIHFACRHVCNSAAIANFPTMHLDMVRLGISLYGLKPSAQTAMPPLVPVMTVKTMISHIHTVPAGQSVSYGATFRAEHDMRVATVPIGYADGYVRAYARDGYMTVCGKRAKIVGRICMDQCMLDVTEIPQAVVGTSVIVFGQTDPTADTLAQWSDTINYEVTCIIGKRVPRYYDVSDPACV